MGLAILLLTVLGWSPFIFNWLGFHIGAHAIMAEATFGVRDLGDT